jgi:hypothetical protein
VPRERRQPLAPYNGQRLTAVASAADSCAGWSAESIFGDGLWPAESPLLQFVGAGRDNRGRLRGLGDVRSLRRFESLGDTP